MGDEKALLAAILANLDEDTPRVVFADWLDENNQQDRAEFIRVQIAIRRWGTCSGSPHLHRPPARCPECEQRAASRRREKELFAANSTHQLEWMGSGVHSLCRAGSEWVTHLKWFRRGFVERVTCEAEDWIEHAAAIIQQQPVREVTLTTMPEGVWADMGSGDPVFSFSDGWTVRESEVHRHRQQLGDYSDTIHAPEHLLGVRWQSIKFEVNP